MRIESQLTDDAVLAELGERLARTRLERNLTQRALADEAGVARKVVHAMEAGAEFMITSLIRVLRALGLLESLDRLVAEPAPSPIELLKLHGKERKRASGTRRRRDAPPPDQQPWRWGDETP
jgi:transcriptional regulator with XRE-family HTH domain